MTDERAPEKFDSGIGLAVRQGIKARTVGRSQKDTALRGVFSLPDPATKAQPGVAQEVEKLIDVVAAILRIQQSVGQGPPRSENPASCATGE